jgi:hypothetical protein
MTSTQTTTTMPRKLIDYTQRRRDLGGEQTSSQPAKKTSPQEQHLRDDCPIHLLRLEKVDLNNYRKETEDEKIEFYLKIVPKCQRGKTHRYEELARNRGRSFSRKESSIFDSISHPRRAQSADITESSKSTKRSVRRQQSF